MLDINRSPLLIFIPSLLYPTRLSISAPQVKVRELTEGQNPGGSGRAAPRLHSQGRGGRAEGRGCGECTGETLATSLVLFFTGWRPV